MIKNEFLLLFCLHLVFFNLLSRHGYMWGVNRIFFNTEQSERQYECLSQNY